METGDRRRTVEASLSGPAIHDRWESVYRTPGNERVSELVFARVFDAAGAPDGARWLDAGCGPAIHALRLARRGYRVVGLDMSDAALATARRTLAADADGARVELVVGNLLDLPFGDGSFDAVLCWGVLMHVPDVKPAVRELARVVRPGGRLVVGENNLRSLDNALLWIADLARPGKARRSRTAAGLERWFETPGGTLLTRQADQRWLQAAFQAEGLRLVRRLPGPFTETYTKLGDGRAARAIHRLNAFWAAHVGRPQLAQSNVLVFERPT